MDAYSHLHTQLTHGLALSHDGLTVYVSSFDKVYSFDYNPKASRVCVTTNTTLVYGMSGSDHTTRTLLIPQKVNGQLVVSRGSSANIDAQASNKSSGHSTIKSFNLTANIPKGGYEHATSGTLLGWGLRNDVGVAEHPDTGGIWSVENSVDQLTRNGVDVHTDNPGEELNFLGYLNGTTAQSEGTNFGYPQCLTAWSPEELPDNSKLKVGSPFADQAANDSACSNTTAPRLTFQAHTVCLFWPLPGFTNVEVGAS